MRIDFLLIGGQKCGTTTLYHLLRERPTIYLPALKENTFFVQSERFSEGERWLAALYEDASDRHAIIGGGHAGILCMPEAVDRVAVTCPGAKLVAVLRNPIDRAYSAYWFARRNGSEREQSFEAALELEEQRLRGSERERLELTYLSQGHYAEQLVRFVDRFGKGALYTVLTEDLRGRQEDTLRRLLGWLGLATARRPAGPERRENVAGIPRWPWLQRFLHDPDIPVKKAMRGLVSPRARSRIRVSITHRLLKWNVRAFRHPPMKPQTRERLADHFAPHNERLECLIGRDLKHWR